MKHGDGVKDITFQVEDCDFLVKVTVMYTSAIVHHLHETSVIIIKQIALKNT